MRFPRIISDICEGFLSLLFPVCCPLCGSSGELLCDECLQALPLLQEPLCPRCSIPGDGSICPKCLNDLPLYDGFLALAPYSGAWRTLVRTLKYSHRPDLAGPLGRYMSSCLSERIAWNEYDFITAVPLYHRREKERGYNQAELLAKAFAGAGRGLPYRSSLQRIKESAPQHILGRQGRKSNLKGVFSIMPGRVNPGDRILLLDDILTTGATASACTEALIKAGAGRVTAVALTRRL